LQNTVGINMSVSPNNGSVAVFLGPVALPHMSVIWQVKLSGKTHVPCRRSIVGLSSIVITFSMAAHVQDLVVDVAATFGVQRINVVLELLPLSERLITLTICRIGAIDQAEVGSCLFTRVGQRSFFFNTRSSFRR
jgi:hypothetical protein